VGERDVMGWGRMGCGRERVLRVARGKQAKMVQSTILACVLYVYIQWYSID